MEIPLDKDWLKELYTVLIEIYKDTKDPIRSVFPIVSDYDNSLLSACINRPKTVGEIICKANFIEDSGNSWIISGKGESCFIKSNSDDQCIAVVYCVGDSVVGIEIDDNCASKVVEPLIEKYNFENVKWLIEK